MPAQTSVTIGVVQAISISFEGTQYAGLQASASANASKVCVAGH